MTSGSVPDHADPPPRPADRYGRRGPGGTQWSTGRRRSAGSARPDRHRWRTYAGLAAFAVALLTAVIVVYLRSATGVHVIERGFMIQSPTAVQIEFEVVKAPGADAVCAVRSRGFRGDEVGFALVDVPRRADGHRSTIVRYVLATTALANTGEVNGCRITSR